MIEMSGGLSVLPSVYRMPYANAHLALLILIHHPLLIIVVITIIDHVEEP